MKEKKLNVTFDDYGYLYNYHGSGQMLKIHLKLSLKILL